MKPTLVMIGVLAVVLIGGMFVTRSFAGGGHCGKHWEKRCGGAAHRGCGFGRDGQAGFSHHDKMIAMILRLDLSDEQSQKVRGILKSHMNERIDAMWQKAEARRALKGIYHGEPGEEQDEQAVRRAADRLGDAIAQAAVLKAKLRREIHRVLTPEQRERAKALKARCHTVAGCERQGKAHHSHDEHGRDQ